MVDERGFPDARPGNDRNDVRRMKNKCIDPYFENPLLPPALNDLAKSITAFAWRIRF
jgi:hypothetical protein